MERAQRRQQLKTRGLLLGENVESRRPAYLNLGWLQKHIHLIGPPGVGKTRLILSMFEQLIDLGVAVVVINVKGSLGREARDLAISLGHTKRLTYFDPGDEEYVLGYNPLRPIPRVPPSQQAKAVREGIRAAFGQANFDQTPQLARLLFAVLYAARLMELTLVEAYEMLLPRSPLRRALLEEVPDLLLRKILRALDSQRDQRLEELTASSVARLESFIADPTIRHIFTQQENTLDLGHVIGSGGIFIANLEIRKPLGIDDVRVLARLLLNDIVAQAFAGAGPCVVIADEIQNYLGVDVASILDMGRELQLGLILAHQHNAQFEDPRILASVRTCARTRIVFGGLSAKEIDEEHLDDLFLDRYDPYIVKDEITSLQVIPVEETRTIVSEATSWGYDQTRTRGRGRSEQTDESETRTVSGALAQQVARARSKAYGRADATSDTYGQGSNSMAGTASTSSTALIPQTCDENGVVLVPAQVIDSSGSARQSSDGDSSFSAFSLSRVLSEIEAEIDTEGQSWTSAIGEGRGWRRGSSQNTSDSEGEANRSGGSRSVQIVPFMSHRIEERVSSRTYLTIEEQRWVWMKRLVNQPTGHFVLKVPGRSAAFLVAPYVKTPFLSGARLDRARAIVFAQPCYALRVAVLAREATRAHVLLPYLPKSIAPTSGDDVAY